jgi:hypothetical protein
MALVTAAWLSWPKTGGGLSGWRIDVMVHLIGKVQ